MTVLLLLALALAFILADYLVQLFQAKAFAPATVTARMPIFHTIEDMLPRGVFAAPGQIWSSLLPDGHIRLGVNRLMLSALQGVQSIALPQSGQKVRKGEPIITLKMGARALSFRAPMDGTVTAVNSELQNHPQALYGDVTKAWAVTVQPNNLSESVKNMAIGEEAYQWLRSEMTRMRDFFALAVPQPALAHALQDGGLPAAGVLQSLDDDTWQKFVEEFVNSPAQK
jgi:glycine cleavage system H protein